MKRLSLFLAGVVLGFFAVHVGIRTSGPIQAKAPKTDRIVRDAEPQADTVTLENSGIPSSNVGVARPRAVVDAKPARERPTAFFFIGIFGAPQTSWDGKLKVSQMEPETAALYRQVVRAYATDKLVVLRTMARLDPLQFETLVDVISDQILERAAR